MRPGARIQAAIDLIEAIDASLAEAGPPADQIVQNYFRKRRYAGSKDRREVIDRVYGILRQRGLLIWQFGGLEQATARLQVLSTLDDPAAPQWFDGPHAPEAPSEAELGKLALSPEGDPPDWARYNYPEWLDAELKAVFGSDFDEAMTALDDRAPLGLRVNTLKADRGAVLEELPDAEPGNWSPDCLRLPEGTRVDQTAAYREGRVEIQDEGSQVAALLAGAGPGDQVLDLCAGAGGKSLALAACMENRGQIYAFDVDARKLGKLRERAVRSNVKNLQYIKDIKSFSEKMDKILLDVPCSGSGTWRRSPDLRWRLTETSLDDVLKTQSALLDQGAIFVKPGGQMIYITCSLLPREGEDQIDSFLTRNRDFETVPYPENWPLEDTPAPPTLSANPAFLRMAPHSHQTDGFFVAVLTRVQ